jgi:hypothetical protein
MSDRNIIEIANDVLTFALHWAPEARLMGNVRADEIRRLVRRFLELEPELAACHAREDELLAAFEVRGFRSRRALDAILEAARARRAAAGGKESK